MRKLAFTLVPLLLLACDRQPTPPVASTQSSSLMASARGAAGQYDVGFTSYLIHDDSRDNRPIAVYVWYPVSPSSITSTTLEARYPLEPFEGLLPVARSSDFETQGLGRAYEEPPPAAGQFPLIVYSPGYGGTAYNSALSLATTVVRYGFVFAAVTHWGDGSAPIIIPDEPVDHFALVAFNRPRDISFMLTDLLARNAAPGQLLRGVIDPQRITASGWSFGGYAAMALVAGDDGVCDLLDILDYPPPPEACGPTPADPRIKAIVPLDGSSWVMHFDELARVRVPSLALGEDWVTIGEQNGVDWSAWQARQHAAFSGQPNYRVDVALATHYMFSDFCEGFQVWYAYGITVYWDPTRDFESWLCTPPQLPSAEAHRLIGKYVVAFLTNQQAVLTPGAALATEPGIEFFDTERRSPRAITENCPDAASVPTCWPPSSTYFIDQPGRATSKAVISRPPRTKRSWLGEPPLHR